MCRTEASFISSPGSRVKVSYFSSFLTNACKENGSLYFITPGIFFCCSQIKMFEQSPQLWDALPPNEKAWGDSSSTMINWKINTFTVNQHMLEWTFKKYVRSRSQSEISIKWTPLVHDKSVCFMEMSAL